VGVFDSIGNFFEGVGEGVGGAAEKLTPALGALGKAAVKEGENVLTPQKGSGVTSSKGKGGKKETVPSPTSAAPQATQQSPFEQLVNGLAQTYLEQVNQLQGLVSGSAAPGLEAQAAQGAAGLVAGTPAAQGLASLHSSAPPIPLEHAVGQA